MGKPKTVASRFAASMSELTKVLEATDCGFCRCIKPTPKMVRRKARPNRRHADGPVGEVRMVEDEEGEVEVPELRPPTLSNNVLRFPREED